MIDAVFQLLYQFEGVITEKQIRQALGLTEQQEIEELHNLLATDDRFIDCSNSRWKCTSLENIIENKPLEDVVFVITDIETTGSIQGKDRIIEIASIRVRNRDIIGEFESLVNPQRRISKTIKRLTNISNQTVEKSPDIIDILPAYVKFAETAIFVAHNSLFDFAFINTEIKRLRVKKLYSPVEICTFRLAKKLLSNVKARGVSGLSKYFDYPMQNRHRAMSDVMATKFFLDKFLIQLGKDNFRTLHHLIEFQRERISQKELQKRMRRRRKKLVPAGLSKKQIPN